MVLENVVNSGKNICFGHCKARPRLIIALLLVSFTLAAEVYFLLPFALSSSWALYGARVALNQVVSAFYLPVIITALAIALYYKPKKESFDEGSESRAHYELFIIDTVLFGLYLQISLILWNIGIKIGFEQFLSVGFAMFLLQLSIMINKAEENNPMAIRTPWTESNAGVWELTRDFAANLFRLCATVALLGVFFQQYAFLLVTLPLGVSLIGILAYSYAMQKSVNYMGHRRLGRKENFQQRDSSSSNISLKGEQRMVYKDLLDSGVLRRKK